MRCPRCGTESAPGTTVCRGCGARFVMAQSARHPRQASAAPFAGYPMSPVPPTDKRPAPNAASSGLLVDDDERVLATLRSGVVLNVLSGDGLYKEEAFVTNKRLYYCGKQGASSAFSMDAKVDLENISAVKVCRIEHNWMVLLAVIACVFGSLTVTAGEIEYSAILFAAAVFATIAYFLTAKKSLCVEYAGGNVTFGIKGYTMKSVREFQNTILRAKAAITGKR